MSDTLDELISAPLVPLRPEWISPAYMQEA